MEDLKVINIELFPGRMTALNIVCQNGMEFCICDGEPFYLNYSSESFNLDEEMRKGVMGFRAMLEDVCLYRNKMYEEFLNEKKSALSKAGQLNIAKAVLEYSKNVKKGFKVEFEDFTLDDVKDFKAREEICMDCIDKKTDTPKSMPAVQRVNLKDLKNEFSK